MRRGGAAAGLRTLSLSNNAGIGPAGRTRLRAAAPAGATLVLGGVETLLEARAAAAAAAAVPPAPPAAAPPAAAAAQAVAALA